MIERIWSRWILLSHSAALIATFTAAATGRCDDPASSPELLPARATVERGPLQLTLRASPEKARLSDEFEWILTIETEPDVDVKPPVLGDAFGMFQSSGVRAEPLRTHEGKSVWTFRGRLEPTEPGRLKVGPIPVAYVDRRQAADAKEQVVDSPVVEVEATTDLSPPSATLSEIDGPAEPVELPRGWQFYLLWLAAIAAMISALIALLSWRRRRIPPVDDPSLSARDLAALELDRLTRGGLLERDVKLFYVELSAVVRRFVERTTGIRAPELTTEEFLRSMRERPSVLLLDRERLREFLESADLVKFAGFRPSRDVVEESIRRARLFVALEPKGTRI